MIDHLDKALKAMQAAGEGSIVYGWDHPAVQRQLERATAFFRRCLADRDELVIMLLPGRIVADGHHLPSSGILLGGLIGHLVAQDRSSITIIHGLTAQDVRIATELIQGDNLQHTDQADEYRIRFGRVTRDDWEVEVDATPSAVHDVAAPITKIPMLKRIWRDLYEGGEFLGDSLSTIAAELSAAMAASAGTLLPLADLKKHNEYTFVHTINVGILSSALAELVGLTGQRLQDLTASALLHDIGKRETPLEVLDKPGKLDDAELALMQRHPVIGAQILLGAPEVPDMAPIVAYEHHMNLNGTGYPSPRRRWQVSLASQIVHVADVFDALRTHRPYREALPIETSLEILEKQAGISFDRQLFHVFESQVVHRTAPATLPIGDASGANDDDHQTASHRPAA